MRILAVDTATEACSAALWLDGAVIERYEIAGRTHTERLLPLIDALLTEAGIQASALDGLVAGIGPGSFAGVRIGVGLIKGMALALDRPVVGISSLAMLAQAELDRGAQYVLGCIDARMSEVYFGAYGRNADGLAVALEPETVSPPDRVQLAAAGSCWAAAGTGWGTYEPVLRQRLAVQISSVDGAALPRAAAALKLALSRFLAGRTQSANELVPAYLRDRVALTLVEQQAARAAAVHAPSPNRR